MALYIAFIFYGEDLRLSKSALCVNYNIFLLLKFRLDIKTFCE